MEYYHLMLNRLRTLYENTSKRVFGQKLKLTLTNQDLYLWVMEETKHLGKVTLGERAWYLLNDRPDAFCKLQKKKTYNSRTEKYGFCNNINQCECFREHLVATYKPKNIAGGMEKRRANCIEKYGVENVGMLETVKEKRKNTMANRNYDHIWDRIQEEKETAGMNQVIERVSNQVTPEFTRDDYIGSHRHNKYQWKCVHCGNIFNDHVDYGRIPRCHKCYPKDISKPEIEIRDFIESLGIKVVANTTEFLGNLEYDIYLPDYKIAIEHNGTYWHSSIKKKPKYHVNKFIKSRDIGIHLIQIFGDEWHSKPEIIKNRLIAILGKGPKIFARKCKVIEVSTIDYKEFTNKPHLQGYAHATIKYGLTYDDKLVAVMGFGKSRYTSDGFEMIRFCSDNTVVGGASKIFKHFIKQHDPVSVVSYANRCWSTGSLYKTLGFKNVTSNDLNVGYWYISSDYKRYHRSNFTKGKLVSKG